MKLFCKHNYKFSDKQEIPDPYYEGYMMYNFIYVCDKCGKVVNINERELEYEIGREIYYCTKIDISNIKSMDFAYPRFMYDNECYRGPASTLLIERYLKKGIDLREIRG